MCNKGRWKQVNNEPAIGTANWGVLEATQLPTGLGTRTHRLLKQVNSVRLARR